MGMYLGEPENLVKPDENNPKGYWENKLFTEINHQILLELGLEYFDFHVEQAIAPQELIRRLLTIEEEATWTEFITRNPILFQQAVNGVIERFGDQSPWGWKDPRNTLTLQFWRKVIAKAYTMIGAPYRIKYILCNRNISEVARSLSLGKEAVSILWSYSTSAVLSAIAQEQFTVISYEHLLGDMKETALKQIYHFLHGKNIPQDVLDEGKLVIDPDLYRVRRKPQRV